MKRAFLALSLLLGSPTAWAEEDLPTQPESHIAIDASRPASASPSLEALREHLQRVWTSRPLARGTTAVYVVDAATGEELYRVHEDAALNPASNVKLISTATVLATLGPKWRYRTQLLGAPVNERGVIASDVFLQGNYDPTLHPRSLTRMAQKLAERGVQMIDGNLVLSDDLHRDTLGTSQVRITVRGRSAGSPPEVTIWPDTPFTRVTAVSARSHRGGRSRISVSSHLVETENEPAHLELQIGGRIREGHERVIWKPVQRRSSFTAMVLAQALAEAGIQLHGQIHVVGTEDFAARLARSAQAPVMIASHDSEPLAKIVSRVNKRSINYLSDRLIMTAAGEKYGTPPSMDSAVQLMREWLASIGVDPDALLVDTGSGLSYKTRLTARQIVRVLRAAGGVLPSVEPAPEVTRVFRESLSVGGIDGTLRGRFRNPDLRGSVIGKTGTLTGVIALSGFVHSEDGRELCFSIVSNGHRHRTRSQVRSAHDQLVAELHRYLDTTPSEVVANSATETATETTAEDTELRLGDEDVTETATEQP